MSTTFSTARNVLKSLAVFSALMATVVFCAQTSAQTYSISDQCTDAVGKVAVAADCQCGNVGCQSCGPVRHQACATCDAGCELEIKEEKVKKTCFEVEKKTICIPSVQLPFGLCCKPLFARSKTIKVLKTKTYECPTTKYIWSKAEPKVVECETVVPAAIAPMTGAVAPAEVHAEPTLVEPPVPAETAAEAAVPQPVPVLEAGK